MADEKIISGNGVDEKIKETGQVDLGINERDKIYLLSIIGEIEGHDCASSNTKTTKYEHVLPKLAEIEHSSEYDGLLVILNTVGGDVECGLAISEMIASLGKPTVSLVLGGSHSIGVPLAVSCDHSFVVPTGTMVVHPVRMSGLFIGVIQTFDYFRKIQDRITSFVVDHCGITRERFQELMLETGVLTKDVGSILVGQEMVDEGIIDEVGGIHQAMEYLKSEIRNKSKSQNKSKN